MSTEAMRLDEALSRRRTRWTIGSSAVAHAVLLVLLSLWRATAPDLGTLTEVTLLEPGEPDAGSAIVEDAAPPQAAPRTESGVLAPGDASTSFRREPATAEVAPEPQSDAAWSDVLEARLATLQRAAPVAPIGGGTRSTIATAAPIAVPSGALGGGAPLALHRGGEAGAAPALDLARGAPGRASVGDLARVSLPDQPATRRPAARATDAQAQRTLAGTTLRGPIADRPVLSYATPVYPQWAKAEAVEASVTLSFVVLPDGRVKENIVVDRTAGFEDFDANARTALQDWRFQALPGGHAGEQWGTITFHYRIRNGG